MTDPENPGATTASSTPTATTDPTTPPAPPAGKDVPTQLAELRELLVEHAAAMGQLHDMTSGEVEAVSKDVVTLRGELTSRLDSVQAAATAQSQRIDTLEARLNDALVRLGVDKAPPPSTAPAKPARPMVFDGVGWVPAPDEEPAS